MSEPTTDSFTDLEAVIWTRVQARTQRDAGTEIGDANMVGHADRLDRVAALAEEALLNRRRVENATARPSTGKAEEAP